MTGALIPQRPRSHLDSQLIASLDRPLRLQMWSTVFALVAACAAVAGAGFAWYTGAIVMAALALRQRTAQITLCEIWREGTLVDVTVRGSWHMWDAAYVCRVELDGRSARVILRDAPTTHGELTALVAGDAIAVRDSCGRLRLGRLR